ncbi:hypothetical protein AV530_006080 [Patagioenas fasciata monilis]|uniref:Uncharacterized protein n=1 Tax=Patagioenas fasciata monilis TaxID=372326 RepID=A0A1V4J885_PATFA|nr:hypothetical protein AV530_006080 [Patagioenas fasciata monilis]
MGPEAEIKKQVNPFYCNICKIWCASALNFQTCFFGFKHKTVRSVFECNFCQILQIHFAIEYGFKIYF